MTQLYPAATLVARVLLGGFFLYSGLTKLPDVPGFAQYVAMGGLPAMLAWPAVLFEIAAGALILVGYQTRLAALAAAAFCVVAALLYHMTPDQAISFNKNMALAGGYLALFGFGAGRYALQKD